MAPRIRFADSRLGRVAHASIGSGPPLILDVGWITHLERMWELAGYRELVEALAATHRVLIHDRPGCGLSNRDRTDWSHEAEIEILRTMVAVAGAPVRVFAASMAAPTAIAVAAREADAIDRLVLHGGTAFGAQLAPPELRTALPALVRSSWGLGPRVFAEIFFPSEPRETLDWYAALQRDGADAETAARMLELFYDVDVRDQLANVGVPTLVLHRRDEKAVPASSSIAMAERIPGAELLLVDGDAHAAYMGDVQTIADAVARFLAEGAANHPLTDREREVAELVSEGLTNAEIGKRLTISPRTVESHVGNIREKLDLRSRAQIASWIVARRAR
ncbi:MAG: alpha/beta fold hydrolase [Nitriliruptorales bacterium]|nr:alpha/beta fold hydrolase [Nitriliruptorales bacterium]